jgi:protein-disulfide isomerase
VLWYFVNLGLGWAAWRCRDAHLGMRDLIDDALGMPAVVAAAVFAVAVFATMRVYDMRRIELEKERDATLIPALVAELEATPRVEFKIPDDAPSRGPADAEVTIIEFGDFECPFCRKLWTNVEQYVAGTDRRVRVVFAHYPLDSACNPNVDKRHPDACAAAIAAECARRQDKFFEYGQRLFDNQAQLARTDLLGYANDVGLDATAFKQCLDDPTASARVRADVARGTALDITGTPTFFINGYRWTGALPPAVLAGVIEGLLDSQSSQ